MGYRQIYAGLVKTITQYGRILIPASEVEQILGKAGIYNGEKKPVPKKVVASTAELWKQFLAGQRAAKEDGGKPARAIAHGAAIEDRRADDPGGFSRKKSQQLGL